MLILSNLLPPRSGSRRELLKWISQALADPQIE